MRRMLGGLLIAALASFIAHAQIFVPIPAFQFAGGCYTKPLDSTSASASVAYSMRSLKTGVTKTIQIQRSSDSTNHDVTLGTCGDASTSDIGTFCAATDRAIRTWYDQSGNSVDLVQTTFANMAKIVTGGTLDTTFSTHGSPKFNGTTTTYQSSSSIASYATAAAYSFYNAAEATAGGSGQCNSVANAKTNAGVYEFLNSNGGFTIQSTGTGSPTFCAYIFGSNTVSTAYTMSTLAGLLARYDGTNLKVYVNGSTGASNTMANIPNTALNLQFGESTFSPTFFTGFIAEMIWFKSNLSAADSNILGPNAASYWGLASWSNIS